ncbi:hypothetical protein [Bacillus sp. MUM 13]|uniref:hypothetical protein n=1 Tax=Bacillus sp. MUM 13 TaxID=1678001 RepID=UPI0008F5A5BA|nr:hypothetical protein [Bacillus sp. MUM 13]OIK11605.1 hypothetical protein BIV59_11220 [Bacillus sp. MUM 13]
MFKKSALLLFTVFLTLAFGSGAFAAENTDTQKALSLIDAKNAQIDNEIQKASAAADELQSNYFEDIKGIEGADAFISLRNEQTKLEAALVAETDSAKADSIRAELAPIDNELALSENSLKQKSSDFAGLTEKYNSNLNALISALDTLTSDITANAIQEAAELGVSAQCELKLVKIAHKLVWIDPIQVVGH